MAAHAAGVRRPVTSYAESQLTRTEMSIGTSSRREQDRAAVSSLPHLSRGLRFAIDHAAVRHAAKGGRQAGSPISRGEVSWFLRVCMSPPPLTRARAASPGYNADVTGTPLEASAYVRGRLAELLPDFEQAASDAISALHPLSIDVHSGTAGALSVLVNQATNDFLDLLYDLLVGRGRSALRTTRSLLEHLVTSRDLLTDRHLEERYLDHRFVVEAIAATLDLGDEQFSGKELLAARHRRRTWQRDSARAADEVTKKYGSFAQWNPASLLDRATAHGVGRYYEFYRYASGLLHGSSGAVAGTMIERDGRSIHRLGPALAVCPIAYRYGVEIFRLFLEGMTASIPDARLALPTVDALTRMWPQYLAALEEIGDEMWPEEALPGLVSVIRIHALGHLEWFIHDAQGARTIEAEPLSPLPADVEPLVAEGQRVAAATGQDQTIALIFRDLRPKPGSQWRSDQWLAP